MACWKWPRTARAASGCSCCSSAARLGTSIVPRELKFLAEVRRILEPGDSLLLGTDLEKPSAQLLPAYDDELGVTAAFNLNLLARINRELDADFDLSQFAHVARINPDARSVEMHLRVEAAADREHSGGGNCGRVSGRRNHMDGKQPQVFGREDDSRRRATPDSAARPNGSMSSGLLPRTC